MTFKEAVYHPISRQKNTHRILFLGVHIMEFRYEILEVPKINSRFSVLWCSHAK